MKKVLMIFSSLLVAVILTVGSLSIDVSQADDLNDQSVVDAPNNVNIKKNGDKHFDCRVNELLKKDNFCGTVLIIKNGQPLYSRGVGYANFEMKKKNQENTAFEIDSIQKNLTAGLLMKLVEEHKVSLDDKLAKFFPEIPGSKKITLRQMLDMKSGLVLANGGPKKVLPDARIVDTDIGSITFSKIMYNKWQYSPVNFVLLARIVEKITHKTYKQLFTEEYIHKLNLHDTTFAYGPDHEVNKAQGYTNRDPLSGQLNYRDPYITKEFQARDELGTGQVFMSPSDLYKLENYLVAGNFLSEKSRAELFIPASISTYGGGFYNSQQSHRADGWGYGFQSVVHISDDGQTAVVVMTNYQRLANDIKPMVSQLYMLAMQY